MLSGRCLCCAAHGFSCIIKVTSGVQQRTILFDTGPDPLTLMNNAARLGVDFGEIDAIVLSHGHFDHVGAVLVALDAVRSRNGGLRVPLYLHPGMFCRRAQLLPNGIIVTLEDVPAPELLREHGADLMITTQAENLFDGLLQVSGEIERVTPFEAGLPGHLRRTDGDQDWEPDPLIVDERFLIVNVVGKGLVVLSACSHAGVINVLHQAHRMYPETQLHAVVGGLHLAGGNESIIPQTVEAMKQFDLAIIAAGHCTGWRALAALFQTFGTLALAPTAVGKSYTF